MLSLVTIKIRDNFLPQRFVRCCLSDSPKIYTLNTMLKEEGQYRSPSIIGVTDDKKILKLIKPRRFLECFKLLYGRSRVSKEVKGNIRLQEIGVAVPEIYEVGYGFIPAFGYDYIGYYLMENLVDKGMQDLSVSFNQPAFSKNNRQILFTHLIGDLLKMRENKIVFSDLTLGNVFGSSDGHLVWIDTGITEYPAIKQKRFREKFNFSLNRFLFIHKDILYVEEKIQIESLRF